MEYLPFGETLADSICNPQGENGAKEYAKKRIFIYPSYHVFFLNSKQDNKDSLIFNKQEARGGFCLMEILLLVLIRET